MFDRLRWWLANAICPRVDVVAQYRGLQHIEIDVKLKALIRVRVMEPKDVPPSGVDLESGGTLTNKQVQDLIDGSSVVVTDDEEKILRPVPHDVIDRLRGQLEKEGKLPAREKGRPEGRKKGRK